MFGAVWSRALEANGQQIERLFARRRRYARRIGDAQIKVVPGGNCVGVSEKGQIVEAGGQREAL